MGNLTPTKHDVSTINGGSRLENGDIPSKEVFNNTIENSLYAVKKIEEFEKTEPLNKGTIVFENGKAQVNWSADKKLTVIKNLSELGLTAPTSIVNILNRKRTNCIIILTNDDYNLVSDAPGRYGLLIIFTGSNSIRPSIEYNVEVGDGETVKYMGLPKRAGTTFNEVLWQKLVKENELNTLATKVEANTKNIKTKANQSEVDTLTTKVKTNTNNINTKANQKDVNALATKVQTNATDIGKKSNFKRVFFREDNNKIKAPTSTSTTINFDSVADKNALFLIIVYYGFPNGDTKTDSIYSSFIVPINSRGARVPILYDNMASGVVGCACTKSAVDLYNFCQSPLYIKEIYALGGLA